MPISGWLIVRRFSQNPLVPSLVLRQTFYRKRNEKPEFQPHASGISQQGAKVPGVGLSQLFPGIGALLPGQMQKPGNGKRYSR